MKHLSDIEIQNYFLQKLSSQKMIWAGIHLDECEDCFSRYEEYENAFSFLENDLVQIEQLSVIEEYLDLAAAQNNNKLSKKSLISLIETYIQKSGGIISSKLSELLNKLKDPAYDSQHYSCIDGNLISSPERSELDDNQT